MKFVPYHLLDGRPSLVVDGSAAPGTVLTVTPWPGYPPPVGIEDDLSAQMAFRLLERPDLVPDEAEAVSNNHFDQDGLVSIYALVAPNDAVHRRTFLQDVALAATSPSAATGTRRGCRRCHARAARPSRR